MDTPFRLPGSVNTSATPAAVTTSTGSAFTFYKGAGDDPGIYVTRSFGAVDQGQWSQAVRLPGGVNTSAAPSAVDLNGTLYVSYKGVTGDSRIFVLRTTDSTLTWYATQLPGTVNTDSGPDLCVSGNTLYIFYQGVHGDQGMYIAELDPDTAQWNLIS